MSTASSLGIAKSTCPSLQTAAQANDTKEQVLYWDVSVVKRFDKGKLKKRIIGQVKSHVPKPITAVTKATKRFLPQSTKGVLNGCTNLLTKLAKHNLSKDVIAVQLAKKIPLGIQTELAKMGVSSKVQANVHHSTSILIELTIMNVDVAKLFSKRIGKTCWQGMFPIISCFKGICATFMDVEKNISQKVEETVCKRVVGHLSKVLPEEIRKSSEDEGLTVEVVPVKNPYTFTSIC